MGHAVVYAAHLALIGLLCVSPTTTTTTTFSPDTTPKNQFQTRFQDQTQIQNLPQALSALRTLESLSQQNGHSSVTQLMRVSLHFGR